MHQRRLLLSASLAAAVALAFAATAARAADVGAALEGIKPIVDARLRAEHVEQSPLGEEADALTLRARLGFETGKVAETSLLIEGEGVVPLQTDYRPDPAVAEMTAWPVVPDPEGYEVNRFQLTNTSLPGTTITLGRQRILLDDHRFVGNVGWRQNEQTFDALRVINRSMQNFVVDLTYFDQVNRVFGPESPQGRYEGDNYLANLSYQTPLGKITAFAYLLDFDSLTVSGVAPAQQTALNPVRQSTDTLGLRFAGERPLGDFKLAYVASYAEQNEAGANPLDIALDYYNVEVTGTFASYSLTLGQEVLQGDGIAGFTTPLATLHKFQGWTDKFLTTPAIGIDDRYVSVGYAAKNIGAFETLSATAAYRVYNAEFGSTDLGNEINLQVAAKYQRFVFTVKYGDYDAEEGETPPTLQDTKKYWLQVDYAW